MLIVPNKKYKNIFTYFIIAITLLWPIFFVSRSIDCMDSGFYLAHYKHYFDGAVRIEAATSLSYFIGGVLYKIMPSAKFLSFRILDWIVMSIVYLFSYKIASKAVPKFWAALSILAGSIFIRRFPMMLSYNSFTLLILIIALYFLQNGVLENNKNKILISGFMIGINVFFRLPNALHSMFVFVPLLSVLSHKKLEIKQNTRKALFNCLYFTLAGFAGLLTGFLLSGILQGFSNTVDSLKYTLALLNGGAHAPSSMYDRINIEYMHFKQYIGNLSNYTYYIAIICIGFGVLMSFIKNKFIIALASIALAFGIYKTVYICIDNLNYVGNAIIIVPYFISLIMSIISLLFIYKNKTAFTTSVIFIMFLLMMPIGTDNGVMQSCIFMYIVFLNLMISLNSYSIKNDKLSNILKYATTIFASIVLLTFTIAGAKNILFATSYGDGAFHEQEYTVNIPSLWGMKSSKQRTESLQSLYDELQTHSEYKDRDLLMFGDASLVYEITDYKPYYREVWADLGHIDKDEMFNSIEKQAKKPIVLIADLKKIVYINYKPYLASADALCEKLNYTKKKTQYYTIYYPEN